MSKFFWKYCSIVIFICITFNYSFAEIEMGTSRDMIRNDDLVWYVMIGKYRNDNPPYNWITSETGGFGFVDRGYEMYDSDNCWRRVDRSGVLFLGDPDKRPRYKEEYCWEGDYLIGQYYSMANDWSVDVYGDPEDNGKVCPGEGCTHVDPNGQKWLKNTGERLTLWDSSALGGVLKYVNDYLIPPEDNSVDVGDSRFCAALYRLPHFDSLALSQYADKINTFGNDPESFERISGQNLPADQDPLCMNVEIKSAYVLRHYSGCKDHLSSLNCNDEDNPWQRCTDFEDHIYAEDEYGNPLGEVGIFTGLTPYGTGNGTWMVKSVDFAVAQYGGAPCYPLSCDIHEGIRDNTCLPSCGALGGTAAFKEPCRYHGMEDAGNAYDTPYCCKDPVGPDPDGPGPDYGTFDAKNCRHYNGTTWNVDCSSYGEGNPEGSSDLDDDWRSCHDRCSGGSYPLPNDNKFDPKYCRHYNLSEQRWNADCTSYGGPNDPPSEWKECKMKCERPWRPVNLYWDVY